MIIVAKVQFADDRWIHLNPHLALKKKPVWGACLLFACSNVGDLQNWLEVSRLDDLIISRHYPVFLHTVIPLKLPWIDFYPPFSGAHLTLEGLKT